MTLLDTLRAEPALLLFAAGLLGLIMGSFLNVVIHRLPQMMKQSWRRECGELLGIDVHSDTDSATPKISLLKPRSRCPQCRTTILAWHNIPILSYLLLRGRCAHCHARISLQYPAVEFASGLMSVAVIWHFSATVSGLAALALTWALIAAATIDIKHQILPDNIVLPMLWLGLGLNIAGVFTTTQSAVIGAIAGYVSLWLVFQLFRLATGKEGMGYGDFKLLALVGAWLGWQYLPATILLASAVGAVVGILLMFGGRLTRNVPMAFGPFLAGAGWLALIWGPVINHTYLHLSGFG